MPCCAVLYSICLMGWEKNIYKLHEDSECGVTKLKPQWQSRTLKQTFIFSYTTVRPSNLTIWEFIQYPGHLASHTVCQWILCVLLNSQVSWKIYVDIQWVRMSCCCMCAWTYDTNNKLCFMQTHLYPRTSTTPLHRMWILNCFITLLISCTPHTFFKMTAKVWLRICFTTTAIQ